MPMTGSESKAILCITNQRGSEGEIAICVTLPRKTCSDCLTCHCATANQQMILSNSSHFVASHLPVQLAQLLLNHLHTHHLWVMISFITWNILLEGLCRSNLCRFESSVCWVFAGIEPTTFVLTVPRSDQLSFFYIVLDDIYIYYILSIAITVIIKTPWTELIRAWNLLKPARIDYWLYLSVKSLFWTGNLSIKYSYSEKIHSMLLV